ncbi:hypothetical protein [Chryseobacterium echinoideorum]|uniref:hypothetical protein n=1 Tax=Chryseobacterium echinoideorum TaxID=1549648 RepID=UPI001186D8D4|nr:hypothetical protein [Chryseobacterium echinoideorum]
MKNSVKIALGVAATGILVFLQKKLRKRSSEQFIAPDGNRYKTNETYRTANGELYRNGKKLNLKTPGDSFQSEQHFDSNLNTQKINQLQEVPNNVSYHQKGNRHH